MGKGAYSYFRVDDETVPLVWQDEIRITHVYIILVCIGTTNSRWYARNEAKSKGTSEYSHRCLSITFRWFEVLFPWIFMSFHFVIFE